MQLRLISLLTTLTALALNSNIASATPVLAQETIVTSARSQLIAQRRRAREQGWEEGKFLENLNLTATQKQDIEKIRQKYQPQITQKKTNLGTVQQELKTMMAGTESNSVLRAKHQEVVRLRQELENLHFESMLQMREILTTEQRAQLVQMIGQRRGARRPRP